MSRPMQPMFVDQAGGARFVENTIVRFLLDEASAGRKCDLNRLATRNFPQADWEQFYQLIGYSLRGYHELSFISDESALAATAAAKDLDPAFHGCRDTGCDVHRGVPTLDSYLDGYLADYKPDTPTSEEGSDPAILADATALGTIHKHMFDAIAARVAVGEQPEPVYCVVVTKDPKTGAPIVDDQGAIKPYMCMYMVPMLMPGNHGSAVEAFHLAVRCAAIAGEAIAVLVGCVAWIAKRDRSMPVEMQTTPDQRSDRSEAIVMRVEHGRTRTCSTHVYPYDRVDGNLVRHAPMIDVVSFDEINAGRTRVTNIAGLLMPAAPPTPEQIAAARRAHAKVIDNATPAADA